MYDAQGWRPVGRGDILKCGAGYIREPLVDVGRHSFARRAPDQSGHGVDQLLKLALAFAQRELSGLLLVDVDSCAVPACDPASGIARWYPRVAEPAIGAVVAAD